MRKPPGMAAGAKRLASVVDCYEWAVNLAKSCGLGPARRLGSRIASRGYRACPAASRPRTGSNSRIWVAVTARSGPPIPAQMTQFGVARGGEGAIASR